MEERLSYKILLLLREYPYICNNKGSLVLHKHNQISIGLISLKSNGKLKRKFLLKSLRVCDLVAVKRTGC